MGAVVTESQQPTRECPRAPRIHHAIAPAGAVLFDFDYTLADSSEGIVVCMNHALGASGWLGPRRTPSAGPSGSIRVRRSGFWPARSGGRGRTSSSSTSSGRRTR